MAIFYVIFLHISNKWKYSNYTSGKIPNIELSLLIAYKKMTSGKNVLTIVTLDDATKSKRIT